MPLGEILSRLERAAPASEPTPPEERLLNVEEAAARLGCTPDWLYRQKYLPFTVKVGRLRRYSETGLSKWIRQREGR